MIKIWVRLSLQIFCGRSFLVSGREVLAKKGPLLITANHPNSFLDAIIIASVCKHPIHFLARGDAFNKPWHRWILGLLQMIPVYRLSEGKENLHLNEYAFDQAKGVLENGGIVLIFIEGVCVNKHALQPFKKGAARIALASKDLAGLKIVPLGIAYDSFTRPGKRVVLNAGTPVNTEELFPFEEETKNIRHMNELLYQRIGALVKEPEREAFVLHGAVKMLGARMGQVLHKPLYDWISRSIKARTRGTVFFDSVMFSVLMLVYPLYLALIAVILFLLKPSIPLVIFVILLHLVSAFCAVRYRRIQ